MPCHAMPCHATQRRAMAAAVLVIPLDGGGGWWTGRTCRGSCRPGRRDRVRTGWAGRHLARYAGRHRVVGISHRHGRVPPGWLQTLALRMAERRLDPLLWSQPVAGGRNGYGSTATSETAIIAVMTQTDRRDTR
jgi:hypothetical protein